MEKRRASKLGAGSDRCCQLPRACSLAPPPRSPPHHLVLHKTEKSSVPVQGENLPSFCKPRNRGAAAPQPCSGGKRAQPLPPHAAPLPSGPPLLHVPAPSHPVPYTFPQCCLHPPFCLPTSCCPPFPAPDRKLEAEEWLDGWVRACGAAAPLFQGDPAAEGRRGGRGACSWKLQRLSLHPRGSQGHVYSHVKVRRDPAGLPRTGCASARLASRRRGR